MASGKSTVGPRLARRLECAFVDLDDVIEKAAGRSIPDIFAAEGEAAFREREATALRATAAEEHVVVALGGGALAQPDALRWARAAGTVVYLQASPAELARRLAEAPDDRPLLRDAGGQRLTGEALRTRIEAMLAERAPHYERADLILDTDERGVEETTEAIAVALRPSF